MRLLGGGLNGEGGQVGECLYWVGICNDLHGHDEQDLRLMWSAI